MSDINKKIVDLRSEYTQKELSEENVLGNPQRQFESWLNEALEANVFEPHATTLSTCGKDGMPSSRIVLLREVNDKGYVFYTNYNSQKGKAISTNPNASLNFFWFQLERQVRVEGVLEKVDTSVSDAYFESRPHESKIGAWVSEQSSVIKNRKILEDKFEELSKKYANSAIPRPPYWGGYLLKPTTIEFWQGRANRLHDRVQYTLENGTWKICRLAP